MNTIEAAAEALNVSVEHNEALSLSSGSIDPAVVGDPKVVGSWKFVPEFAPAAIKADVELLYGK